MTTYRDDTVTSRGTGFYGWIIVAASILVTTIAFGSGYSFGVFITPWRETFGWTTTAISAAYSICLFFYTGMGVLAGWSADRYGPKAAVMTSGILIGSGLVLTSQVIAIWQLYISYALIGMGMSCTYSPLMTTVSRWFDQRRGLALGIIGSGISAGPLIAAPVAKWLISGYGWRPTFLAMACASTFIIAAAFMLKKRPPDDGELLTINTKNSVRGETLTESINFTLKEAVRTRVFWLLCGVFFGVGFGLQMVIAHIVAYGEGRGLPPVVAAIVLSAVTGGSIAGRILLGMVSDRIGRKKTLAISIFLEASMIVGLIVATHPWMFFLIAAIFGFGYGGHGTQFPALIGETLGLRHMGAILGTAVFFWGIGGALGTVIAGYVFDITHSYGAAFTMGVIAMLMALATTFFVKNPKSLS
ncbi:MAG: MFS transporter [Chloroflexi bacterium]|nr:MFS transporter [Chloroflexota bacterium]